MCVVSISLSPALPAPVVNISPSGVVIVGQTYSLTCSVMVVPGLVEEPTIMWTRGSGTLLSGSGTSLQLNFNPLLTSDSDVYTCRASIDITNIASFTREATKEILLTGTISSFSVCC